LSIANAGQLLDDEETKRLRAAETLFDSVGVPSGLTEETLGPALFRFVCVHGAMAVSLPLQLCALLRVANAGKPLMIKTPNGPARPETFFDSVGVLSGLKEMNPEPFSIL
jgi:hypothetical protein